METNIEIFRNLRVAVYRWEHNDNDPDRETHYLVGISDAELMLEYCEVNNILPNYTIIEQAPKTLNESKNLPKLSELMNLAKSGEIDVVLINRMYMFSSTITGFYNIAKYFNQYGVKIFCIDEPFSAYVSDECLVIHPEPLSFS